MSRQIFEEVFPLSLLNASTLYKTFKYDCVKRFETFQNKKKTSALEQKQSLHDEAEHDLTLEEENKGFLEKSRTMRW